MKEFFNQYGAVCLVVFAAIIAFLLAVVLMQRDEIEALDSDVGDLIDENETLRGELALFDPMRHIEPMRSAETRRFLRLVND